MPALYRGMGGCEAPRRLRAAEGWTTCRGCIPPQQASSWLTYPPSLACVQGWCFGVMGQRLATRIRVLILRAILRQASGRFLQARSLGVMA